MIHFFLIIVYTKDLRHKHTKTTLETDTEAMFNPVAGLCIFVYSQAEHQSLFTKVSALRTKANI